MSDLGSMLQSLWPWGKSEAGHHESKLWSDEHPVAATVERGMEFYKSAFHLIDAACEGRFATGGPCNTPINLEGEAWKLLKINDQHLQRHLVLIEEEIHLLHKFCHFLKFKNDLLDDRVHCLKCKQPSQPLALELAERLKCRVELKLHEVEHRITMLKLKKEKLKALLKYH